MPSSSNPKIQIVDQDGEHIADNDGRLKVDIAGATINTGDIDVDISLRHDNDPPDSVQVWSNTVKDGSGTPHIPIVNSGGKLQVDADIAGSVIATYPQFDVDTSYVQLSSNDGIDVNLSTCKEIVIQCDFDNTGYVMIGNISVAADTNGIRLEAGDTLTLSATSTESVYLIGSAINQMVNVMTIA